MTETPAFRGNSYRHSVTLNRWLARARKEPALEPDLPIIDPHHHLSDDDRGSYLLPDIISDIGDGHDVTATIFIECRTHYRAGGPEAERPLGEVEFVNGISAMSASGGYGPIRVAAAMIGHADLRLGENVQDILEKQLALTGGRMRGVRWPIPYDASEVGKHVSRFVEKDISGDATWRAGFSRLAKLGLTFEGWCYHPQIPEITALARAFPDTTIILNHVGGFLGVGPYPNRIKDQFQAWKRSVVELATCPNVVVKLGGLGKLIFGFDLHMRDSSLRPTYWPRHGSRSLRPALRPSDTSEASMRATSPSTNSHATTPRAGMRLTEFRPARRHPRKQRCFTIRRRGFTESDTWVSAVKDLRYRPSAGMVG